MLVPSQSTKEFLETATSAYADQLVASEAEAYLIQERGLTNKVLDSFRIGFVDKPLRSHEMFWGRIVTPYITTTGVVSLRFRRFKGSQEAKKVLYIPGDQPRMYNVKAFAEDNVFICEGEIDTMTAEMCGYPAIGIPGATSWKKVFAPAFRYRTVTVVAHNDDNGEGMEFAKKISETLDDVKIQLCPRGHDLNSLYVSEGLEAVKELLG